MEIYIQLGQNVGLSLAVLVSTDLLLQFSLRSCAILALCSELAMQNSA